MRGWATIAGGLAVVGAVIVLLVGQPARTAAPQSIVWGAEVGPQFTGTGAPWDMSALHDFAGRLGRAPGVVAFNLPFENCTGNACTFEGFPVAQLSALRRYGSIPMLNWSSQSSPLSPTQPGFALSKVAGGSFDHYLRTFALEARVWGHPLLLRFDWEMNEPWFPWGATVNGNSAARFVAAWRHVHDIFTSEGASNVTWVWCPYAQSDPRASALRALYPGSAYVDWTCLDGYNFGAPAGQSWRSFAAVFHPSYAAITRDVAPGKPMILGEVASSEGGGSKPRWISAMLRGLPERFPRIRALVWFDATDTHSARRDAQLPLESSPASLRAFGAGLDATYAGNRFASIDTIPTSPSAGRAQRSR